MEPHHIVLVGLEGDALGMLPLKSTVGCTGSYFACVGELAKCHPAVAGQDLGVRAVSPAWSGSQHKPICSHQLRAQRGETHIDADVTASYRQNDMASLDPSILRVVITVGIVDLQMGLASGRGVRRQAREPTAAASAGSGSSRSWGAGRRLSQAGQDATCSRANAMARWALPRPV